MDNEERDRLRRAREKKELVTKLETDRGPGLLSATKKFLDGYRQVAGQTGYSVEAGVQTINLHADEHQIEGEVFTPTHQWDKITNLLGDWYIYIATVSDSANLLAEDLGESIITLKHIPPEGKEADPKAFSVEFFISQGKVSGLNIRHPLSRPGHEREVARSEGTTVEYAAQTLRQLGERLSEFHK